MAMYEDSSLHGETFSFGPGTQQNSSVGQLGGTMADYWEYVRQECVSAQDAERNELGVL